jgi:hypothetical protein
MDPKQYADLLRRYADLGAQTLRPESLRRLADLLDGTADPPPPPPPPYIMDKWFGGRARQTGDA